MIEIKYRIGLPTEKCLWELIYNFWGDRIYPNISWAYKHNGTIVWQQKGINERVDEFIGYLGDYGIEVIDYSLYENMMVGHIWIKKLKNRSEYQKKLQ